MIQKPQTNEISSYFMSYIDMVSENDLIAALKSSELKTSSLFSKITVEQESFAYSTGKWTIKQVLHHIIDTERIFAYRALRFSRLDNTELSSYDEDLFAENSNSAARSLKQLVEEFVAVRQSTIFLFESMNDKMLDFNGMANKNKATARTLGFTLVGHNLHHCNIIESRYL